MGEIRIVGPGKTRGYPYPVCKKEFSSTAKTRTTPVSLVRKRKPENETKSAFFLLTCISYPFMTSSGSLFYPYNLEYFIHHIESVWLIFSYHFTGGGRVVRRCWVNIQCRGVLLTWITVGRVPIVLAVGAGGGVWTFFSHLSLLFSFSLSLGDGPISTEILSQSAVKPKTTN